MRATVVAAALAAISLGRLAAQPDYFPLQTGNQWIYRGTGTRGESTLTLEVTRSAQFSGRTYHLLHVRLDPAEMAWFPEGDYWLRMDENGSLLNYDPDQEVEKLWYAFRSPERQTYTTAVPGTCCGLAVIASRRAEYRGPVGEFNYALEVRYPGVFQLGLVREFFLPHVGLVHRTQNTGGPTFAAYDLIYCRLGGVTHVAEPLLSFGLALDRGVYFADLMPSPEPKRRVPVMTARLTLRNTRAEPVLLIFPSGQSFDLVLKNERGETVYRWSAGKFFTEIFRRERFGPGERNYALEIPLADAGGNPLPAGRYVAEAWLTTAGRPVYTASTGFEIRHVF